MSGGIAYIFDPDKNFQNKCNAASVDLLPLDKGEDIVFVKESLEEFMEETGSEVATRVLHSFETMKSCFVKVFPHEYQRALNELEMERNQIKNTTEKENGAIPVSNGYTEANEKLNGDLKENNQKTETVDEIHSNGTINGNDHGHKGTENNTHIEDKKETKCKEVADIEDAVSNVEMKKRKMEVLQKYDKVRGFVKYERENKPYREPKSRQNDWEEIFNFKHVRKGKMR